jgi:hypothetical protein
LLEAPSYPFLGATEFLVLIPPDTLHLLCAEREESKMNWDFGAKSVVMTRGHTLDDVDQKEEKKSRHLFQH